MPNSKLGHQSANQGRFALVASRFNRIIVDKLVGGAKEALADQGVAEVDIDLFHVPGAFEIPFIARRLAMSRVYAAVVCLGAVIRGETDHYEYVARAAADGILRAGLDSGVPVIFGILTCDTLEQAFARAGTKANNKGFEAALAAIDVVNLLQKLPEKG
jgi:6,7-dimethyl-8-ribityllumazine synthase